MDIQDAERVLAASPHHRVLKRIPAVADWRLSAAVGATRRGVYVDVETTGLRPETDEVIELALLPFEYDALSGGITRVAVEEAYCSFRQPGFPIPVASTRIHGITDSDVAGAKIDDGALTALVADAHLILAHNAGFDRPMVEKHWPIFETRNWACSFQDIAWRDEGFGAGKLDYLLMSQGWFYDGHRALGDALAGVFLLAQTLPVSRKPALSVLLECARRPLHAVRAEGTAFEKSAALRDRGYRWDPGAPGRTKSWWIQTNDPDSEIAWLNREIYSSPRQIRAIPLPATRRYSARLWG